MAAPIAARRWREADGEHIDVRGLAPPQPLVAILALVRELDASATPLTVHHERDPLLLYGELEDIGWTALPLAGDPGEVRLRLERVR
ncbi:MAG: DUF2249 domain-containing protein [Burkholderiales bacterium]|nr:DUF2249 domain-containing protein [Burkholderiales bacterium]MDE2452398.1 DUF2249 domain-containing protein [Burkholderiales bacterium]